MQTMQEFQVRCDGVSSWLATEYAGIRTGQATPALLDNVKVESYGTMVPLNQVGNVGVEDARTLRISVWNTDQISAVEAALRDANLGLSVTTDSGGLRAIFPELTSERRSQLLKLAKSKLEDARVSLRGARDEILKAFHKHHTDGELSEDEEFAKKEEVQKITDSANKSLDEMFSQKENEISS